MVQERNYPPRKAQAPDLDVNRRSDPRPIPPAANQNSGTPLTDIASGLALLLSVIAFFLSAYAAIQASNLRRGAEPAPRSNSLNAPVNQPVSRPVVPFLAQSRFQRVEPGQFLQPTQDDSGEVELISANRSQQNGINMATIQMRIRRLDRPVTGVMPIDLPNTVALNTRTNEKFPTIRSQMPNDQIIAMSGLQPGATINASVTVRVPQDLDRIDLDIPNVRVFRNVPIG